MNRPRLIRGLRIAWSVWWGILCLLLIVLWVRSYSYADRIIRRGSLAASIHSDNGKVIANVEYDEFADSSEWETEIGDAIVVAEDDWLTVYSEIPYLQLSVSHWIPAALCCVMAALSWLPWNFSLRTLLIATALMAFVLGLIVWWSS